MLGKHVELLSGYAFKSKEFNDTGLGVPVVRIRDVGKEKSETFYNGEYSDDYLLDNGDLLIGMDGDFRLAEWKGGKALLNQRVCKITPKDSSLDRDYMYYMLPRELKRIEDTTSFATVKHLSVKKINNIEIPLPPLDQQKKIAAILDAADAYRQKTKALIKKYDELTQSLFLDMFGDPVTNPMGWELLTFKDVLEIRNGKSQKTIENENGIYPICGSGGIMSYGDDFISEANSVIIGRKGNINKPILMKERYWHVDTAFGLNPIKTVLGHDYLYWFCVRYNFEQHNKTVTIPSLTKETLLRIKIPTPPIELQNQFAGSVQAIEAQKAQAQASLAQAEDLFNSLLQRAFKGELV